MTIDINSFLKSKGFNSSSQTDYMFAIFVAKNYKSKYGHEPKFEYSYLSKKHLPVFEDTKANQELFELCWDHWLDPETRKHYK